MPLGFIMQEAIMRFMEMVSGFDPYELIERLLRRPKYLFWAFALLLILCLIPRWERPQVTGEYEISSRCTSFSGRPDTGYRWIVKAQFHTAEKGTKTLISYGFLQIIDNEDRKIHTMNVRCVIDVPQKSGYVAFESTNDKQDLDMLACEFLGEMRKRNLLLKGIEFSRDYLHWNGTWLLGRNNYGSFNAIKIME